MNNLVKMQKAAIRYRRAQINFKARSKKQVSQSTASARVRFGRAFADLKGRRVTPEEIDNSLKIYVNLFGDEAMKP